MSSVERRLKACLIAQNKIIEKIVNDFIPLINLLVLPIIKYEQNQSRIYAIFDLSYREGTNICKFEVDSFMIRILDVGERNYSSEIQELLILLDIPVNKGLQLMLQNTEHEDLVDVWSINMLDNNDIYLCCDSDWQFIHIPSIIAVEILQMILVLKHPDQYLKKINVVADAYQFCLLPPKY